MPDHIDSRIGVAVQRSRNRHQIILQRPGQRGAVYRKQDILRQGDSQRGAIVDDPDVGPQLAAQFRLLPVKVIAARSPQTRAQQATDGRIAQAFIIVVAGRGTDQRPDTGANCGTLPGVLVALAGQRRLTGTKGKRRCGRKREGKFDKRHELISILGCAPGWRGVLGSR